MYKRQLPDSQGPGGRPHPGVGTGSGRLCDQTVQPVSYTHLDVYKRQRPGHDALGGERDAGEGTSLLHARRDEERYLPLRGLSLIHI